MDTSPISIAEQLLGLVRKAYVPMGAGPNPQLPASEIYETKYLVEDLCGKLLRSVLGPLEYTTLLAGSCQESSALGFITALGVPDVLGDNVMTIQEMADSLGVKPKYLKVTMGILTKHGYFDEFVQGATGFLAYRNNDLSNMLKESHPNTLKDAIGFICDEGFRATSYVLPASKVSLPKGAGGKDIPAINLAFGFDQSVFEWMSQEAWRGERLGKAMQQLHRMANGNVVHDYGWSTLDAPIVDVGGGIGSLELALVKTYPQHPFEFIIFDIPMTIENAKKVWELQPISRGSITFQGGNFMAPGFQETGLPGGKPTYVIRHVLHDWSDEDVLHILNHVRTAMSVPSNSGGHSKLVLCEMLLRGDSHRFTRITSMQLLALNGGSTRTETEMVKLVERAGFSVLKSHRMRAVDTIIEAIVSDSR